MQNQTFQIDVLSPDTLDDHITALAEVLNVCVAGGASVSFVLPHTLHDSMTFWTHKVRPGVLSGDRVVLAARVGTRIAGSVQLDCDTPPNQPHRAEVSKLLVHPEFRKHGIARALMIELEQQARRKDRNLLTLDTASDKAERLYMSLGYHRVGAIPSFARDPIEDRYDPTTIMYKIL